MTIGVTGPSGGVHPRFHARLELALGHLRQLGYRVKEGGCLRDERKHVSAPAPERVAEAVAAKAASVGRKKGQALMHGATMSKALLRGVALSRKVGEALAVAAHAHTIGLEAGDAGCFDQAIEGGLRAALAWCTSTEDALAVAQSSQAVGHPDLADLARKWRP